MKTRYGKMSDSIILDRNLRPSSKRVYLGLLRCQHSGTVRRTYLQLAKICGCSVGTVRQGVAELASAGYITIEKKYWYCEELKELLRDTNAYHIIPQNDRDGYTLVPFKLLDLKITNAALLVALYLMKRIGMKRRAWPSLRRGFQASLGLSRTTICAAIRQLAACGALFYMQCLKTNNALSCNTYMILLWGESCSLTSSAEVAQAAPDGTGGSVLSKHQVITKITGDYTLRRREKGVGQFGKIHKVIGILRRLWNSVFKRPSTANTG